MHKTAKADRFFRAGGLGLLTRWPTLVAFLLISAFSGSGFQTAGSMLQQCRHLFSNDGGNNTLALAKREQPRIAIASTISDKQNSAWPGSLDGLVPSAPAIGSSSLSWRSSAMRVRHLPLQFTVPASARGPPSLS